MTFRFGPGAGGSGETNRMVGRHLQSAAATSVLLVLCSLVAACGVRAGTFELPPRKIANRNVYPWRVAVVAGKEFTPFTTRFRYWSTTPYTWSLEGLPGALVETLGPYFLSVEPLHAGRSTATGRHDLIATMSVDRLHFDGANTTGRRDRVDLTMVFTLEQPNGTEVFRSTVSASGSSPYTQPCTFCKPDPSEAFKEAFSGAFAQLSEALGVSDIRFVHEDGSSEPRNLTIQPSP